MKNNYQIEISKRKERLDVSLIHQFLTNSYWAEGRTLDQVKTSLRNSECYGVFKEDKQIAFARIISDKVVFAYILDVFVIENERGNGYASKLMEHILNDKEYSNVQQWYLKTKDAQPFYNKFGFRRLDNENWFMIHTCE